MIGTVWKDWIRRPESYNRADKLDAAARATRRGRKGRAIAEYSKVLTLDPGDFDVHAKVAPLLAQKGRYDEAWTSYTSAAEGFHARGFTDRAIGIYRQAGRCIPGKTEPWESVVRLQMEKGLKADAVNTLVDAAERFKGRKMRPGRIKLLRRAFDVAPWHPDVTFTLAASLAKSGSPAESLKLFNGLAERTTGREHSRVRLAILLRFPSPGNAWRWAASLVSRRRHI